MTMRFEGEFRVPGPADAVLAAFDDVERMVRCMPGVAIEGRDPDGRYLGSMLVAFGPKKIKFKGKVLSSVDMAAGSGQLHVRGAAEMRMAAPAEVQVNYTVRPDAAAATPTSVVSIVSDAELGGVLADFARTGGVVVTQALMEVFAERLAQEFSRPQPAAAEVAAGAVAVAAAPVAAAPDTSTAAAQTSTAPAATPAQPVPQKVAPTTRLPAAAPEAFSAGGLFWRVMKLRALALLGWIRGTLGFRS